jgi:RNase P subunit RPR2
MGRADILICPDCDYKRRLTEAESLISYALVVACLKCGAAMQCSSRAKSKPPERHKSLPDAGALEALEEWAVP